MKTGKNIHTSYCGNWLRKPLYSIGVIRINNEDWARRKQKMKTFAIWQYS